MMVSFSDEFKKAMSRYASGVTIVATVDDDGKKWGFTASSFSSLSLDPPMILVCLAQSADCFGAFSHADVFSVNIIGPEYEELAYRFAKKNINKFSGGEFIEGKVGTPVLPNSLVSMECSLYKSYPGGDHKILVGSVLNAQVGSSAASVWYDGQFHRLETNAT